MLINEILNCNKAAICTTPITYDNCFDIQLLPQVISNWDAHVLKDIQNYKIVDETIPPSQAINSKYNYLPIISHFSGNKTIKP